MKLINKQVLIKRLKQHNAFTNRYAVHAITHAAHLFEFTLADETMFDLCCFHSIKASEILSPPHWYGGRTYSFSQVINRFIDLNLTFSDLTSGKASGGPYSPQWFQSCQSIDDNFDQSQLRTIVLQPIGFWEKRDCPTGLFRVLDGNHRLLVYGLKVAKQEINFEPLHGVMVIPGSVKYPKRRPS